MNAVRPGVVDLRDLASRAAWEPRAFPRFVAAAGLAIEGPAARRFAPPRVVVVIAPYVEDNLVDRSCAWLAEAAHVVLVRDHHDDGTLITGDPEMIELLEDAWATVLGELGAAEVFDWYDDPAPCRAAIARALALAATVEPAPPASPPAPRDLTLPTGAWCAYTDAERRPLRGVAELTERLAWRGDRPGLALDADGGWIDLGTPPPRFAIRRIAPAWPATPVSRPERFADPGRWGLGFDPVHPVGWRGDRMRFYWSYVAATGVGFLSASDHDYPCGPVKRLYDYEDNDPVQIVLSPAADVCVARFGHDVLVTSAVPIGWQAAGAVDVATFPRDPRRAVWFAQDPARAYPRRYDLDLLDDDSREHAPALVLGPDDAIRYAVDLGARVYRIDNRGGPPPGFRGEAVVVKVGGGGHQGYAVFDADHREVRRGAGRLLGGWFRWATIEHDGHYWREDLATGARTRLAPVDHAICDEADVEAVARDANLEGRHDDAAALRARHPSRPVAGAGALDVLAIPGTRNVLLVGERHLRVI